ncbi:MAG TPA: DUF1992 domain-containing protein [Blastocatellia bacterium]|nr:DUF1992 domain-containing protein [Blastocatellia bacterium]
MSFEKLVENIIRDAMDKGEFDDLPGRGRPIDLTAYFATPEDRRLANSILKNANIVPEEIELLREIETLNARLETCADRDAATSLKKLRDEKRLKLDLLIEQRKRKRR